MFTLRLHSPILLASGRPHFVRDLTPDYKHSEQPMRARGWRRSIRANGGFWQGEFTLYGSVLDLSRFFYEYIGFHVEERSAGVVTWEGMVYEMELTTDGATRRISIDSLYNSVQVKYRDSSSTIAYTTAATDTESIRRYGQREQIWPLDGQDATFAEQERDTILKEHAWPKARPVGTTLGVLGEASLFVRVCGYVFTANWRYETAGDGTQDELSDWIILMIDTDCPFLEIGRIERNEVQVWKTNQIDLRVWDVITKLLEGGSEALVPMRAYVDYNRRFYYETINTTPVYFKRGGGFYTAAGGRTEANPWQVRPAVVRDLSYPVAKVHLNSWLADARDWYMNEVDVWDNEDGTATLQPKGDDYEEGELLSAQAAYQDQIRRGKAQKKAKRRA